MTICWSWALPPAIHFHLDDRGVAAGFAVFGLEDDHGVVADHEDVANAEFLSGFHKIDLYSENYKNYEEKF